MTRSITVLIILIIATACNRQENRISLAGKWNLCLDSVSDLNKIDPELLDYSIPVSLPSTLDSAGIGKTVDLQTDLVRETMLHLQRKVSYVGPAYYRKEIFIPKNWEGKHVLLKLERVIWESVVWVDGKKIGNNQSLSTPHYYDLSLSLSPGKHSLIICIDNSRKFFLNRNDMAHAYTEETQIQWNGILGDISLTAHNPSHISELILYPDFKGKELTGKVISVLTGEGAYGLKILLMDANIKLLDTILTDVTGNQTSFRFKLSDDIKVWDEFSPVLYKVVVSLVDREKNIVNTKSENFGFRTLEARGRHIYLNGNQLFLRGTLECSIFPLTGHPPLDEEGWIKVFSAAREYGLNHLRFHSWCPPEAAFNAADKMGMYLQVELPNWSLDFGLDKGMVDFIYNEAESVLSEYGNHPSFLLISMGNELEGNFDLLTGLVTHLKNRDPRHLYTTTTYSFQAGHGLKPESVDDYYITQNTEKGWVRGQGVFDQLVPDFKTDYTASIDHISIPMVSHEIGQYSVFPGMKEIEKYTGVLYPGNFIAVKNDLEKKGLLERAEKYTASTGKFASLLYKEEIERALKTPGLSGFQLLDLHDFPGQGTALVGVLDAFWDSKGFVSGEEWRMFCSEVVPLLWFDKAVYTTDESFSAEFGIADYYRDFENATIKWRITGIAGNVVYEDSIIDAAFLKGNTSRLGSFNLPLSEFPAPAKYTIELSLQGTSYRNQWNIWLYNREQNSPESSVILTSSFKVAIDALQEGKKVLLSPDIRDITGITGKFVPVFWSPVHFPNQPGTMGLLIDPEHKAFRDFPTDFYSNWQWWDLCKNSKTLDIDSLSVDPVVIVVDNFFKNRNLCNIFEAKLGQGMLVFTSVDLHSDLDKRPVARQLNYSLLNYMNSSDFKPGASITADEVLSLKAK